MLTNKSVLITGGTGSFGKMFTKLIFERFPEIKRLVILSRDEQKHYQMAIEYPENKYPAIRYFIGDVRDPERLRRHPALHFWNQRHPAHRPDTR